MSTLTVILCNYNTHSQFKKFTEACRKTVILITYIRLAVLCTFHVRIYVFLHARKCNVRMHISRDNYLRFRTIFHSKHT